ncbi:MAG: hypothetical protein JWO95_2128 [Verrucomicrobiales bacterium]|nr:hypothetical protein [Verrucomicrobiales bacterium]
MVLGLLFCVSASAKQTAAPPPVSGDLLQFLDGSALHGQVTAMNTNTGVRVENPNVVQPIAFKPNHVDFIRFSKAEALPTSNESGNCHFRFFNGDEVFGVLNSLNDQQLELTAWFGSVLKIPRQAVQSITFLSRGYRVVYEGPTELEGWSVSGVPGGASNWWYRDGSLFGAAGTLGRKFDLTNSCTVEFDLSSKATYQNLMLSLYTDSIDRLDFGNDGYIFTFSADNAQLRRAQRGVSPVDMGSAVLAHPDNKDRVHITIHANKEDASITLMADNKVAKRWKDSSGFAAKGTGLLFENIGGGQPVRISNLRISSWQGRFEPDTNPLTQTNADSVLFANRDRAQGKITAFDAGKVSLTAGTNNLQVPMERVRQITFAPTPNTQQQRGPWEVRAYFLRGGMISFRLASWDKDQVSGESSIFGPLSFQTQTVREMEFNLDKRRGDALTAVPDEFGGGDNE